MASTSNMTLIQSIWRHSRSHLTKVANKIDRFQLGCKHKHLTVFDVSHLLLSGRVLLSSLRTFSTHWSCWCSAKFHDAPYHWDLALCTVAVATSSGEHRASSSKSLSTAALHRRTGWLRRQPYVKNCSYTSVCFLLPATVCHHTELSEQTHSIDVTSQCQNDWKLASVVTFLVDDPLSGNCRIRSATTILVKK